MIVSSLEQRASKEVLFGVLRVDSDLIPWVVRLYSMDLGVGIGWVGRRGTLRIECRGIGIHTIDSPMILVFVVV